MPRLPSLTPAHGVLAALGLWVAIIAIAATLMGAR